MDDQTRRTLFLIESALRSFNVPDEVRHPQLLHLAADYVRDGDITKCWSLLAEIDILYLEEVLPRQAILDAALAEALAVLVEVLGTDFITVFKTVGKA